MIVNPDAYEAGIKRNIINNARKTFHANVEDSQEILGWINRNSDSNDFALSVLNAYYNYGKLTAGQCEAVRKCIAREAEWKAQREQKKAEWAAKDAAEKALAQEVPEGRVVITGQILSTKWYESDYGSQLKCVIKDDRGFKVYGSVPNAIVDYAYSEEIDLKGKQITLTATVSPSDDDPKFGFFKRPAKAQLV